MKTFKLKSILRIWLVTIFLTCGIFVIIILPILNDATTIFTFMIILVSYTYITFMGIKTYLLLKFNNLIKKDIEKEFQRETDNLLIDQYKDQDIIKLRKQGPMFSEWIKKHENLLNEKKRLMQKFL